MNKQKIIATLAVIAVAITVFSLTTRTQPVVRSNSTQDSAQSQAPEIPDEIAYRHLFRYVTAIEKQAEEAERKGKDATSYRTHFKRMANLGDYHARMLDEIAVQYMDEVQVVDARARALVEAYRAQYPGGKVPHGERPAAPPAELKQLREQRDAITLRHRDNLHNVFGDDEFDRFNNEFVKRHIAPLVRQATGQQ